MTDQTAAPEVQATAADLSPLSPSPLHSAASVALPALQDTADLLDTLTEMPSPAEQASLVVAVPVPAPAPPAAGTLPATHQSEALPATTAVTEPNDEFDLDADAESLDDPYGDQDEDGVIASTQAQAHEPEAGDDDYLKSFDSPAQDIYGEEDPALDSVGTQAAANQPGLEAFLTNHSQGNEEIVAPASVQAATTNDAPIPKAITSTAAAELVETPSSSASSSAVPSQGPQSRDSGVAEVDISRLVAEMAGQASESTSGPQDHAKAFYNAQDSQAASGLAHTPSSLPPRPPMPQQAPAASETLETYHQQLPNHPAQPMPTASFMTGGAPGTSIDNPRLPPPPAGPTPAFNAPTYPNTQGFQPVSTNDPAAEYERSWQQFVDDERRYMAEANWERFPEGTRIFIGSRIPKKGTSKATNAHHFFSGNLSSERVSKRDVFDMFHRFGRLAQISLKSAYGFVQYHDVEEAQGAMQNLQNVEIKGRKIHLEISRIQKKKGREGRDGRGRSPDKGASDRGGRNGRDSGPKGGRADASQNRRSREDVRSGRAPSPRRNREEPYSRDRAYHDSQLRGRSRSPQPYARQPDQYRRRSPTPPNPYRRGPSTEDQLQIPRRYGNQVPDVQFLLLQEVGRDFVEWVERAFTGRGLKVDVMFLNPNFPRDAVIQRQAVEGVHGIVDLDMRAHTYGKIPLRVFDRSTSGSARYDDYQDLDPQIAAELISRAKSQAPPQYHASQPPPQPAYGAGGYGQHYPAQHRGPPQTPAYPTGPTGPTHGHAAPGGGQSDMERVLAQFGNLDGATLQQLVAAVQASQHPSHGGHAHQNGPQLDINAILSSLNGGASSAAPTAASYAPPTYPTTGPPGGNTHMPQHPHAPNGPNGVPSDSASQVNTIMAQLAKFRQP